MLLNKYQDDATITARDFANVKIDPTKMALANWALGLTGEAGEAAELIKKHVFHGHDLDLSELRKEIGDVMWYLANLAKTAGLELEDIGMTNLEKLRARYGDGFTEEKSKNRAEYSK